ncbi:MAG: hypothetical protein H6812_04660 [Phycisphaeraceae bacterium]|nr:hypothetical protein [Phycisphaeraceae bacterium]
MAKTALNEDAWFEQFGLITVGPIDERKTAPRRVPFGKLPDFDGSG